MAMEIAYCSRSFAAGCTSRPPVKKPSASARGFHTVAPPCPSFPSSSSSSQFPAIKGISPCLYSVTKQSSVSCFAVEGKSTSSSSTTAEDAGLPSPDAEQSGAEVTESPTGNEEQESIGKALREMRQERVVPGEEKPSKTEEFWRGVLEETSLIEWPSLQKVLGTTGVVTSIIVGSSLVLLTVNAILAQLSDAIFKNAPPA